MDKNNTQAAWQSRTNLLIVAGLVAMWLQRAYGISIPVEAQGLIVDLVPIVISTVFAAAIWFRNVATRAVDRWF